MQLTIGLAKPRIGSEISMTESYGGHRSNSESSNPYSPFDHIPNELLALVLVWTWRGLGNNERFKFPFSSPRLVCQRWKRVIDTTPALWSTLYVNDTSTTASLSDYLRNSGSLALSLEIMTTSSQLPPILMQHVERLEQVTVWAVNHPNLNTLFEQISTGAGSLRHLSGFVPLRSFDGSPLKPTRSFAPTIESLHLNHVLMEWKPPPFALENLTELVLVSKGIFHEGFLLEGLFSILHASPKLQRLHLFTLILSQIEIEERLRETGQRSVVELKDLTEMVMVDVYTNEFLFLTSRICCPNLKILGVGILAHGGRKLPQNIDWNGLSPEYPKLEQLDIWLSKTNPTHLLLATQKISTVSTLGIRGSMTSYEEETLRKTVQFLQLIRQLNICSSSVETLWTRAINARVLTIIVKDIFPKTKTVYVFPGDLEASDIIRGGIRHRNEEITPILPWSEEKGSWYLEVLDERRSRIETCFKSLTDA